MKRLQQIRRALGSEAILTVIVPDDYDPDRVVEKLWLQIEQFEQKFSRFLPESELSYVNRQAGKSVTVSPEFAALFSRAIGLSQKSEGIFNPFVLPALNRAGYLGSWPTPQDSRPDLNYSDRPVLPTPQPDMLQGNKVTLPKGSALDFGGIGKGYLLDLIGVTAEHEGIEHYWFSLGGDIRCRGNDIDEQPWRIGIANATSPTEAVASMEANTGACGIATSGVTKRKGIQAGAPWHHLIDPRSGLPADTDILTISVQAPSAVEADVWAKCMAIVGSKQAEYLFAKHPLEQAIIQTIDGRVQHLDRTVAGALA